MHKGASTSPDPGPARSPRAAGAEPEQAVGHAVGDVGYPLKRAQHALRLAMDAALAALDLTTAPYAVLAALERAEGEGDPASSGAELARRCFVTPQTMTGLVAGLEARGLVRRRPHPTHGRVVEVAMTAAGRAALRRAHRAAATVETRMLAGRTAAERRQLAAWLRDCADALRPAAGGASPD